jgi:hypothetical protein
MACQGNTLAILERRHDPASFGRIVLLWKVQGIAEIRDKDEAVETAVAAFMKIYGRSWA